LIEAKDQQIAALQQQLKDNELKWQQQFDNNDAKWREHLVEVKERAEKAEYRANLTEKRMEEKDKEWLSMFKNLYELSKTGELSKMKEAMEETLSKQVSPVVSITQSPNPHLGEFQQEQTGPSFDT